VLSDANDVVIQTYDNLYGIVDAQPPAATPIPTGGILLWSGSIGSIPAGYVLCNGNNGTPDLRDRFIVGAGSTYAVDATGGSADSILPTHTHGATSTSVVTDPSHLHQSVGATGGSLTGFAVTDFDNSLQYNTSSAVTGITVATTTTNASAGVSPTT
jgi:hypothetical protein